MTNLPMAGLIVAALTAAQDAAEKANAALPPENARGFDRGFAWVVIKPARGPFVAECKRRGLGDKHYAGGWSIWYSRVHNLPTQSISVHEAACEAFADVLKANGVSATCGSRLD